MVYRTPINKQTKGLRNGGLALINKCGVIWHGKRVGGGQTENTGSLIGGTSFLLASFCGYIKSSYPFSLSPSHQQILRLKGRTFCVP